MLSVVLKMVVSYKHYNKDSETTEGITECSGMICLEEEQYILYKYSSEYYKLNINFTLICRKWII